MTFTALEMSDDRPDPIWPLILFAAALAALAIVVNAFGLE